MESKRLRQNDKELFFHWLMDLYRGTIYGEICSFVRENESFDLEDVIQDMQIKIWDKLPYIYKSKNRKAYLRRFVKNTCLDMARKKARRPVIYLYDDFGEIE